jgi:hypothetical protein
MAKRRFEQFETDTKVLAEAESVARSFCDATPVSSRMCDFQGMFSKSAIVRLSDETEVSLNRGICSEATDGYQIVVQLKDNEIDTTKTVLANTLLGDVVPISSAAISNATFAYVSPFIPGTVWVLRELSVAENVRVAFQVGTLIAQCTLGIDGSGMVDGYIIPRIRRILSKTKMPKKVRDRIQELLELVDGLKFLPLSLCHIDINIMNIILDESTNIVGLVDWEQAQLLPVGMNAWCIRYLSVPIRGGVDQIEEKSQPMAEAFWKGLTTSLPPHLYDFKDKIIDSMLIGLVLFLFAEGTEVRQTELCTILKRLDWIESTFRPLCAA